ncbi:hypothetical protein LMH87_009551 [Akanthomyces muscarius]|uniref:Uncharacterized protein n=1 Tax=Akanthomyces muscarius TaxID=2231603 RepID=A0A9W8UL44_AKAMU|nr:hypothetical protein LMH87_009551 [Akanthomyces muscarius]KAJ4153043.1 hypothetical protein LMH87_009551 [Akanthomyces muscarius]
MAWSLQLPFLLLRLLKHKSAFGTILLHPYGLFPENVIQVQQARRGVHACNLSPPHPPNFLELGGIP